ncbi:hypothetical protein QOT17_018884 [Balamuthia mandrillaris]
MTLTRIQDPAKPLASSDGAASAWSKAKQKAKESNGGREAEPLVIRVQPRSWLQVKWFQWQLHTCQYLMFPVENFLMNTLIIVVLGLMFYRLFGFVSSLLPL